MNTITLEEALERATKGPIKPERTEDGFALSCPQYPATFSPCDKEDQPEMEVTNALLAHAYNLLPELVGALENALEVIADYESDTESPKGFARIRGETILAQANTVNLPE